MERNPNCNLCSLKDNLLIKCLPGGGNPITASVVFVGDYPTLEDFNKGQPFSGAAGTFLRNTLVKLGGDPQEYFYTNTLGCKPTEDKKPSKNELNTCRPYYIQEILNIKPKLVVALGAVALESLTAQTGISKVRGNLKWSDELNCYVYPTYHPSAIMRSVELLGVFEEDITKIIEYSRTAEIKQDKASYQHIIINTIDKFRKFLALALSAPKLSTDIESQGFKYLEDRILCISFSHEANKSMVVPLLGRYCRKIWTDEEYKEVVAGLKQIFETVKIILQNGKFDIKFFINELNVDRRKILDNFIFDTMLGHALIEEEERHGLKELAWKYTSFGGYEEELEKYKNDLKSSINKKLPLVCVDTSALNGEFKDKIEALKHHSLKYKAENCGTLFIHSGRESGITSKDLVISQNTPIKKESQIAQIREFIHKGNIERLFLFPNEELTEFTQEVLVEALKPSRSKKDMVDEEGNAVDDFCYDIFPEELLWKYNAIDSDVTIQVHDHLIPLLEAEGVRAFFDDLVMGQNKVLLIMEMNGIYIDTNILNTNRERLLKEKNRLHDLILNDDAVKTATQLILNENQKEIEDKFDKLTYPDWGEDKAEVAILNKAEKTPEVKNQLDYYRAKAKERYIKYNMSKLDFKFNINSPNQLGVLFLDVLKCQPISYTKKGSPQFNLENLDLYAAQFPVADLISKYKSLAKFISMFMDGIEKRLSIDGRLRTDYQQTSVTGRLKSSNPNLQNIPKRKHGYVDPKDIRDFFVAPEGYKLVHMDLAQGEFKCNREGTKILMSDFTEKNIEEIEVGEEILTVEEHSTTNRNRHFKIATVTAKLNQGIRKCMRVRDELGNELDCTPDHKFATFNFWKDSYTNYKWRAIKSGDGIYSLDNKIGIKDVDLYVKGMVYGMFLSDGCLQEVGSNESVDLFYVKITQTDKPFILFLQNFLKEKCDITFHITEDSHGSYSAYTGTQTEVKKFLDLKLLDKEVEFKRGFVAGYILGDGWFQSIDKLKGYAPLNGVKIGISAFYTSIMEYVKEQLDFFKEYYKGFDYRISLMDFSKNTEGKPIPFFCFHLNAEALLYFPLNLFEGKKVIKYGESLFNSSIRLFEKSKASIEPLEGEYPTWDLTTTTGTYVANRMLVHNCWCEYAQDVDLMKDIESGLDIHRKIASYIFKKPEAEIDKLERNKAKFAVFGLIYGRGAKSIAEEFDLTLEQAQGVANYFFSLYPNCRKWIDNQKRLAVQQGQVKNYFGRIRHLPLLLMLQNRDIRDFDQITAGKLAEAQRQCVNSPIQSAVADFIGYSLIRLQKIIEDNNYPVKIMLQIHDAVICEVREDFIPTWQPIMKAEMIRKPEGWRTKIDSETEIGTSYGNLTTVKD